MRALVSVADKTGLVEFARGLAECGVEIVSTGGTSRALTDAGLDVVEVSEVTGFPELMDGRVKTLHPAVHGGILARRNRPDDLAAIARHGIRLVDLVVVNLYRFAETAAAPGTDFPALVEQIDIGGPSLVRAAAKNCADVLVVVDPQDYPAVLVALRRPEGADPAYRVGLARKAFAHTAGYDSTITAALARVTPSADGFDYAPATPDGAVPDHLHVSVPKLHDLRYGENPHQAAALYPDDPAWGFGTAAVVQGKGLSFTNLLDLDAAARVAAEFEEPAAAVIKHTNPCGVATAETPSAAYVAARDVDAQSAFGGIVGLNRAIDEATAGAITGTFIEAVVAPDASAAAREVLAAKKNLRVVLADVSGLEEGGVKGREIRSILGALLVQARDRVAEAGQPWADGVEIVAGSVLRVVTRRHPTAAEWTALRFGWRICAHVKSNTIVFARSDRAAAVGAGQMSRVDAVRVATLKAGGTLAGTVAASDAFFPFRDGLDAIAGAGATAVVQPGGSRRDAEVVAAADEHGLAMVFTGRRHFRH